MSKKTETTFSEEKEAKEKIDRANTERRVAEQIKDVLDLSGYALQPFLSFSEYGVVPRVRLVINPESNDNGTDKSTGSKDKAGDKSAKPSKS